KAEGSNPNHGEGVLIQADGSAHQARVSGKSAPPETIADDRHRMSAYLLIVFFGKGSAKVCVHTQNGKEVSRDEFSPNPFRLIACVHTQADGISVDEYPREYRIVGSYVLEQGIGKAGLSSAGAGRGDGEGDQSFGGFDWKHFQQHGIDQAEDGSI